MQPLYVTSPLRIASLRLSPKSKGPTEMQHFLRFFLAFFGFISAKAKKAKESEKVPT